VTSTSAAGRGAVLLTGGTSRRMGVDKATLLVAGVPLAWRVARALAAVGGPVVEVGPGAVPWLPVAREEPPGSGPLAGLVAGWSWLAAVGIAGPVVVAACDLPRLSTRTVRWLLEWPGSGSVAPVLGGRPQPLCARWSGPALARAAMALASGERSLRPLLEDPETTLVPVDDWPEEDRVELVDADRPEDLAGIGPVGPGSLRPGSVEAGSGSTGSSGSRGLDRSAARADTVRFGNPRR
jgi:molybdopterin-guanine dinucleotide biosynthesis protein A